jgi:hypothetical protein
VPETPQDVTWSTTAKKILSHIYGSLKMSTARAQSFKEFMKRRNPSNKKNREKKRGGRGKKKTGQLCAKKRCSQPGVVVHTCNPSTGEAEAGGWRVQDHSGLHSKTLS